VHLVSNPFIWFDLATADRVKTAAFYQQLFGWDIADVEVGEYRSWIGGAQPWAGIVPAASIADGQWLPYILVDDLEQATEQAVKLGATVVRDTFEGPAGTSVTIADPGGARLALFRPRPA
jgi:uncharacterized protein